jgi:NAD(P)H-hydrate epimerase
MAGELIITHEVPAIPRRRDDAHKGDVGRLVIVGGSYGEVTMAGAAALAANAAFRSGAGLVRIFAPEAIHAPLAMLAPTATFHRLTTHAPAILSAIADFAADVLVVGPGLGDSLPAAAVAELLQEFDGSVVVDADGLNRLAETTEFEIPNASRVVLTPHPGEARRLLAARGSERGLDSTATARRAAACALVEAYGCNVVLKGRGTIVTNGRRLYMNETGNSGLATAGAGDVLTGIIAALIGQSMDPFEAAILGVYLHGLAGDYAAEELGRWSMTALDVIDYLPEAFCEHEMSESE